MVPRQPSQPDDDRPDDRLAVRRDDDRVRRLDEELFDARRVVGGGRLGRNEPQREDRVDVGGCRVAQFHGASVDNVGAVPDLGRQYADARAEWIEQAHDRLVADERVGAAMLTGSLGRGGGDAWSDVDLLVVVRDEVIAEREEFVTRFGTALMVFDSPWNAPLDGGQVNALYDVGVDWLLYVDWDLWPAGRGAIASDVRVLFDRIALPAFEGTLDEYRQWPRAPFAEPTPEFIQRARLAMLPIVLKCGMRGDRERAQRMLTNLGVQSPPALWDAVRADCGPALQNALDRMVSAAPK